MKWTILFISLLCGGLLSYLYFMGLWITVNRVGDAKHPSTHILISFLIRSALLMISLIALFWFASYYALASIVSFIVVRQWLMIKHQTNNQLNKITRKDHHAKKS